MNPFTEYLLIATLCYSLLPDFAVLVFALIRCEDSVISYEL